MYVKTQGLVLREVDYKEADKILTVLTPEGKVTVSARGARRKGSHIAAACQLFALSEMELFEYRGRFSLNEAEPSEQFRGLRDELESFALAAYMMELTETVTNENENESQAMSLALNSLFALNEKLRPREQIKPVFELRLMSLAGFEPMLDCCAVCGDFEPELPRLNITQGVLCCSNCRSQDGISMPLDAGVLAAMRYITAAETGKMFSFKLSSDGLKLLGDASEAFVCAQLERSFKTLDFYKSLVTMEMDNV